MSSPAGNIEATSRFKGYSVQNFNSIVHFDNVRERSDWLHENASIFGSVICKHGLHDVFGVGLVHKHFDLNPEEYLVRNYTTTRFSVSLGSISSSDKLIPYMWRFDDQEYPAKLIPLEFVQMTPRALALNNAHRAHYERRGTFFDEFYDLVKQHNAFATVALVDLFQRDLFDMRKNESLYESTFERSRYITLEVGASNGFHQESHQKSVRTGWWFTPSQADLVNVLCMSHCYAHCQHKEEEESNVNSGRQRET